MTDNSSGQNGTVYKIEESSLVNGILPAPVLHNRTVSTVRRRRRKFSPFPFLSGLWATFVQRLGTRTAPSTSSARASESHHDHICPNREGEDEEVDEIIVDRVWSDGFKTSDVQSDHGGSAEKSSGSQRGSHGPPSITSQLSNSCWTALFPLAFIRFRIWPAVFHFFNSKFPDAESENQYQIENWHIRKPLAILSAVFLDVIWILGCTFIQRPLNILDKIYIYGVIPTLTVPVVIFVMYDFPRDRPYFYQMFLCATSYSWPFYCVLEMYLCGYEDESSPHVLLSCGAKDFLGVFYYMSALPTIALFGLKLNRLSAFFGCLIMFSFAFALIVPGHIDRTRSMIDFLVFLAFLLYIHYTRENAERRLYILREQLKVQYKAAHRAQINERMAADSKRRLTSYVRVPLNTALLAVQNMEASGTIAKSQEIEFKALEGSLSMMSKVLNDVLDFNRMDSGKFESVSKPYSFHQVMRSLFVPLRLATDARGLELSTELDPRIDKVARQAAYAAMGESASAIEQHLRDIPDADGIVVGDETRLRQIITNLASNACKFTLSGGRLKVSTRLIFPQDEANPSGDVYGVEIQPPSNVYQSLPLSTGRLNEHNLSMVPKPLLDWIAVRIEVTDTGCGIRRRDMVESRLFSAFNQTERGRQQGGKGTGLGLALVRQIVTLSGGRLGLQSKVDHGSTFWVELPLGVGRNAISLNDTPCLTQENLTHVAALAEVRDPKHDLPENIISRSIPPPQPQTSSHLLPTARSSSAMHSLMEQGGRVELSLNKHGSNSSLLTRTIGDMFPSEQSGLPFSQDEDEPIHRQTRRPSLEEVLSSRTERPQSSQRPTFVAMPSSRFFSDDDNPLPSPSAPSTNSGGDSGIDRGIQVLVVDDDPWTRTLMKRMLTRLGCKVFTAENGEVALEMILGTVELTPSSDDNHPSGPILDQSGPQAEESKFGVVFLDNQMPVLSGLKVVGRLREMGRHDFVVGVTGNALLSDQEEYLTAGADRILTKPVQERSLKGMLCIAGERRKQRMTSGNN